MAFMAQRTLWKHATTLHIWPKHGTEDQGPKKTVTVCADVVAF